MELDEPKPERGDQLPPPLPLPPPRFSKDHASIFISGFAVILSFISVLVAISSYKSIQISNRPYLAVEQLLFQQKISEATSNNNVKIERLEYLITFNNVGKTMAQKLQLATPLREMATLERTNPFDTPNPGFPNDNVVTLPDAYSVFPGQKAEYVLIITPGADFFSSLQYFVPKSPRMHITGSKNYIDLAFDYNDEYDNTYHWTTRMGVTDKQVK